MGVLLVAQTVFIGQMHLHESHYESSSLIQHEHYRLRRELDSAPPQSLSSQPDTLFADNLRGLILESGSGDTVLSMGSIPDADLVRAMAKNGPDQWVMNQPKHADVVLPLEHAGQRLSSLMRVDVSTAIDAAWANTKQRLCIALIFTLIAGLLAVLGKQKKSERQVMVKQKYLEFVAHHDPLTHLPNRLMFEETLTETVRQATEQNESFALFLIDLDNFKIFNDQYGHIVGDKMVAEVADRLRSLTRDSDLVARLDGDEFVVLQKGIPDRHSAEAIATQLMSEAGAPFEYSGFTLKIAVSIGISCFPGDVNSEHDETAWADEIVN